jgi:hypothetical protein
MIRAESNEEYSSSSMPPKFIGSVADSDISIWEFGFGIADLATWLDRIATDASKIPNPKSEIPNR